MRSGLRKGGRVCGDVVMLPGGEFAGEGKCLPAARNDVIGKNITSE